MLMAITPSSGFQGMTPPGSSLFVPLAHRLIMHLAYAFIPMWAIACIAVSRCMGASIRFSPVGTANNHKSLMTLTGRDGCISNRPGQLVFARETFSMRLTIAAIRVTIPVLSECADVIARLLVTVWTRASMAPTVSNPLPTLVQDHGEAHSHVKSFLQNMLVSRSLALAGAYNSKVVLHSLENALGFRRAVPGQQPFFGIAIMLRIVAPVLAMAQRYQIFRHRSWAIRRGYWYPVISTQGMPETFLISAHDTGLMPVLHHEGVISHGKGIGEISQARTPAGGGKSHSIRIVRTPLHPFFWVLRIVRTALCNEFRTMFDMPLAISFTKLLKISRIFSAFLCKKVLASLDIADTRLRSQLIPFVQATFSRLGSIFCLVLFVQNSLLESRTRLTQAAHAIRDVFIGVKGFPTLRDTTFTAALLRRNIGKETHGDTPCLVWPVERMYGNQYRCWRFGGVS